MADVSLPWLFSIESKRKGSNEILLKSIYRPFWRSFTRVKAGTKDEGHWNPAIVDWGDSYVVSFHKNYIKFPIFFLFVLLDLLFLLGKDHFYPTNGWTNLSDQTPRLSGDVCYWCHAGFQASARGEETHFITVSARALMTSYDNREQPNRMQKKHPGFISSLSTLDSATHPFSIPPWQILYVWLFKPF